MGKTVNFSQTNLIPLMRALKENVELDTYTIGGEPDAPVGGRYYHVSDEEVNEEETLVTESKNSSRAHKQTRQLIAKYIGGVDENDALVITAEQEFEQAMFGEGKRTDWMIVLEPVAYSWYIETKSMDTVKKYLNYIYLKGTETTPPSAYIATIKKLGNFNEVKQFVDQQIKTDDNASREEQANMAVNLNQNYEVCGPLSFDEAHDIGNYSNPNGKICYTQGEDVWESEEYGNYGVNKCYALLRNDWKSVPAEHDGSEANNGLPAPLNQFNGYDNYGLSMIFVWVGRFGNLTVSNTRWNHDADYAPGHGVDLALKELDIARLMGAPFEKLFGAKKIDIDSYVKENLANSRVSLSEIFDDMYEERDGITAVRIGQKYNYVVSYNDESERYLLWDKPYDEWFDSCDDFMYNTGMAIVYLDDKAYFIDRYGKLHDIMQYINSKLLSGSRPENLFGEVNDSKSGAIWRVTFDWRKFNFINSNTNQLLWNKPYEEWFTWCKPFDVGVKYNLVRLGQELYYLDVDGNLHDFLECLQERIKHENLVYVFDSISNYESGDIKLVKLHGRYNYVNLRTSELIWKKPLEEWFLSASLFSRLGKAQVKLNGKICFLTASGELYDRDGNLISENIIYENYESEVESSEVDLSSFKKKDKLVPSIWKDEDTLDSKVRLKLLDIADDFWEFVNLTWVEPKGIILTGSICNFNWSEFSDIDLHLIVDFDDIDDRTDFVRDYMDAKKNEWNNEHKDLKIMGYPVELYVQNIDEMPESGGIYDLEENAWLRKPNYEDIKSIGLDKFSIKEKAAMIMTIIDDMWYALKTTDDMYDIRQLDDDASDLWKKVKAMRKDSLAKNGESGPGNIVYKVMRRMGYLDKLFDLRSAIYDKLNSISEATHKFKVLMIETLDENKELLKEYLDNNYGLPLYKYFKWAEKATDKEKAQDLFWHNPDIIEKYLEDVSDYDEELEELQDELYNDEDLVYDEEFIDRVIDTLERNNLLRRVIENAHVYAYAEELPTWMTMDFIRLVKNEWCIHFTSYADNLAREGFTGGTPDIDDLAYTGAGRQKHYAGYDFAFLIHDRSVNFNNYGDEAVIFRASGVLATHYGDEQDQVIFWGPSVKEIIPIKKDKYSSDWEIEGLDGQIFKTGKPSELADWATDNLPQYRKQILAGKSGYQPWGFSRPKYYNESVNKAESKINEEVVADGNAEHNPFEKRWKAERQALKNFLVNCGKIMTSKENGKQYKVFYDQTISNLIGYNYCICVQWNPIEMKPESTIYIRALDKFTNRIFQAQYDDRGRDNMRGTYDDMGYSQRFENKRITKQMLTEANNKKRFKRQTLNVLAQGLGLDPADPQLQSLESDFRNVYFGHLQNQEIDRVIGYEPLFAKCAIDIGFPDNNYDDTEFTKYVNYLILNTKDKENYTEIINHYKSAISSFNDMRQIVGTEIKASRDADIEQQANMGTTINSNYKVIGPLSFEEAKEYGNYSGVGAGQSGRICYSQYEDTWLSSTYSNDNTNPCFVLLRNDWQQLPGTEHDGSEANNGLGELSQYNAYDDYGLSMIMLFINAFDGSLHECNIRWNHGSNKTQFGPGRNVDHALTEMDISKILGVPFNQAFNVKTFDEKKDEALQKLANGEKAVRVFDMVAHMPTLRLTMVKLAGRINFLKYIDSKEVMFPDYWFIKTEMISNNFRMMCYLNKDKVFFLDVMTHELMDFDTYANTLLNEVAEGENPRGLFDIASNMGSVFLVRIGRGGRSDSFCRWNVMTKHGEVLSTWEKDYIGHWLPIGIDAYCIKFGDKYNIIFRHGMLINKPSEYWAISEPLVCHGERNSYFTYEDANGHYNAYNPITGEYAVPEGTNPWPSKNDVELMIYKKWQQ